MPSERLRVQVLLANSGGSRVVPHLPKCTLSPQEALERLRLVPTSSSIVEWVVASEKHQDGTDHLHAFIKYEED